jgi:uncharacterized iron-regulated membrane protein
MDLRWRPVHRWLGFLAGAVVLIWIVTGMIMVTPRPATPSRSPRASGPDYRRIERSPAQAILAAEAVGDEELDVAGVSLSALGDRAIYRVAPRGRPPVLIDATTGEEVVIDSALAVRVAVAAYSGPGGVRRVELNERRRLDNVFGEVPAYRVEFDDGWGTAAYLGARTGTLVWTERANGRRAMIGSLHDFFVLRPLPGGDRTRLAALWIASLVSLCSILTGYYLWLRGTRFFKRRAAGQP